MHPRFLRGIPPIKKNKRSGVNVNGCSVLSGDLTWLSGRDHKEGSVLYSEHPFPSNYALLEFGVGLQTKILHRYLLKNSTYLKTVKYPYENTPTSVIINGGLSNPSLVRRGVRQGGGLSCLFEFGIKWKFFADDAMSHHPYRLR